jgi:hypothetical protein
VSLQATERGGGDAGVPSSRGGAPEDRAVRAAAAGATKEAVSAVKFPPFPISWVMLWVTYLLAELIVEFCEVLKMARKKK